MKKFFLLASLLLSVTAATLFSPPPSTGSPARPKNIPPVADAGPDQAVPLPPGGTTVAVQLNGSGSYDPDGTIKGYNWTGPGKPDNVVSPTVTLPLGSYKYTLKVTDNMGMKSTPDQMTVTVRPAAENHPPVANAGPDQTVLVRNTVQLNGLASTDVDGDPLTYRWSFLSLPVNSTASLLDAGSATPSFVVDQAGSYVVQLVVNDGKSDSAPATVTISTENSPPIANAGPDQTTTVGSQVILNGSGSTDADGDPITYHWTLSNVPEGSSAALTGATTVNPSFTADKPGAYVVQLVVNDGKADSKPATVTISTLNSPPLAHAGQDQTVTVGTLVTLNGSGSTDVDGDPLTYLWALISIPTGSSATLTNSTTVTPSFKVDKPGPYVAQLIVNDGTVSSVPATVTISTLNSPPLANAGPNQSAAIGTLVLLDGSGSSDLDGDQLSYHWSFESIPSGSSATLGNPMTVNPSFTLDKSGSYVVQLIVNDGYVNSAPATVTISTINSPPLANAGQSQWAAVGSTVQLDGSESTDPDGDALSYRWALLTKPEGSAAVLSASTTMHPTFVVDMYGTYVAQLIVNDGTVNSSPATVSITTDIYGTAGDDVLVGTDNPESIHGLSGNDRIEGLRGNDVLVGGPGDDTYIFNVGDGKDIVIDEEGIDIIEFGSTVDKSMVAFFSDAQGNIIIDYGTVAGQDQITVQSGINLYQLATGSLLTASQVNTVILNITTYATNNGIQLTSVEDVRNNVDLMIMISSSWS